MATAGYGMLPAAGICWLLAAAAWAQSAPTLDAPAEVGVGAEVSVRWSGGGEAREFVTIVPEGVEEGRYDAYQYARRSPVTLIAPEIPGAYEIRYLGAASPYPTLASRPLTVVDSTATLEAPDAVAAGADVEVAWSGPDNRLDFVTLVPAGTPEGEYGGYVYTRRGSPLTLRAPDEAGEYELRYLPHPRTAADRRHGGGGGTDRARVRTGGLRGRDRLAGTGQRPGFHHHRARRDRRGRVR